MTEQITRTPDEDFDDAGRDAPGQGASAEDVGTADISPADLAERIGARNMFLTSREWLSEECLGMQYRNFGRLEDFPGSPAFVPAPQTDGREDNRALGESRTLAYRDFDLDPDDNLAHPLTRFVFERGRDEHGQEYTSRTRGRIEAVDVQYKPAHGGSGKAELAAAGGIYTVARFDGNKLFFDEPAQGAVDLQAPHTWTDEQAALVSTYARLGSDLYAEVYRSGEENAHGLPDRQRQHLSEY